MSRSAKKHPFPPYFVCGVIDFALIGGLSLGLYVLFRLFPAVNPDGRIIAAGALTVALNWPHFSATNFRLYGSRKNVFQYPATALLAPLLALGGVAGSLLSPLVFAPVFLKMFVIWSPYHYSGQTIGITMVYARRSGFALGKLERWAISAFVFLTFVSQSAASEARPNGPLYSGVRLPTFGVPGWLPHYLTVGMYAAGCAAACLVALRSVRSGRLPPVMLFVPAIAQYVWFVPGADLVGFREFVPAFHSVQYLFIAWSMHLHERARGEASGWSAVVGRSAWWMALNLLGGAGLFWLLPRTAGWLGADLVIAMGVVAVGVQVHHFFVDGVIWKLKSRTVASPLMMTLRDLLDPVAAEPRPEPSRGLVTT